MTFNGESNWKNVDVEWLSHLRRHWGRLPAGGTAKAQARALCRTPHWARPRPSGYNPTDWWEIFWRRGQFTICQNLPICLKRPSFNCLIHFYKRWLKTDDDQRRSKDSFGEPLTYREGSWGWRLGSRPVQHPKEQFVLVHTYVKGY